LLHAVKQLRDFLRPGQRIFVAGSVNEPTALLAELAAHPLPDDLEFIQFPLGGYNQMDFTALSSSARFTTFFMTTHLQNADPSRLNYLPMQMRAVFDYLCDGIDVLALQAAYDAAGTLRIGPNVDFAAAVLGCAKVVLVEVNSQFIAPPGCPALDVEKIDYVLDSARPLFEMPPPVVDETVVQIGRNVAALIRDGDCLQTGIGGIPAAILAALTAHNDLGIHGGLIDDGGMALINAGNVTGRNKPIDNGRHIIGMALGSQALIEWLAQTPTVIFKGADYTHELSIIRQIPQFVSINSAVEIDLYGQLNAEFANGRQLSGTGGSVDFMRAAKASPGGRSIIAMTATARGGSVSRIVNKVEMATALRTDIDTVVTQFGVAQLANLPVRARAAALLELAAPEFREALRAELPS
jgi:4-hydroxybutyrate CoA-transferase